MFGLFGFSPTNLTDQELVNKITELQAKLVAASRFSYGAVPQLQDMLQHCMNELRDRADRKLFEHRFGGAPTSKTLVGENAASEEKKEIEKKEQKMETTLRIKRTSRPVKE